MGRIEKIAVITVVFLIVVILAVSLPGRDGAAKPGEEVADSTFDGAGVSRDALRKGDLTRPFAPGRDTDGKRVVAPAAGHSRSADAALARSARGSESAAVGSTNAGGQAPESAQDTGKDLLVADAELEVSEPLGASGERAPVGARSRGLLSSTVRDTRDTDSEAIPEGAALITLEGLEATPNEEFYIYTWRAGDTFTSVVRRYYGDLSMVRLLRTANEDKTDRDLASGDQILVPAFDRSGGLRAGGDAYTVMGGDTLSSIARKVYGDATAYTRIYEVNRDILASPDSIAEGQVLRIPR